MHSKAPCSFACLLGTRPCAVECYAGVRASDRNQSQTTPGLIARIDWTTVWNAPNPGESGVLRACPVASPEEALRHGADAVLTYLVIGTGDADFESKEIARNAQAGAGM